MTLFETALREADKSRFLLPYFGKLNSTPNGVELILSPEDAEYFTENVVSFRKITQWADTAAAKNLQIDWNKLKVKDDFVDISNPEFVKILSGYVDYTRKGGSRKQRADIRKSFADENMFYIIPFETENWMFVAPRNYKACVYADSAECAGQSAKWCIGYEQNNEYWREYIRSNNKFILAVKKPGVADHLNELDYDGFQKDKPARKYMIQLDQGQITTWRPCDNPDDVLDTGDTLKLLGLSMIEFNMMRDSLDDFEGILYNDCKNMFLSYMDLLDGKIDPNEDPGRIIEIPKLAVATINLDDLYEVYEDMPVKIRIRGSRIGSIVCSQEYPYAKCKFIFFSNAINQLRFRGSDTKRKAENPVVISRCDISSIIYDDKKHGIKALNIDDDLNFYRIIKCRFKQVYMNKELVLKNSSTYDCSEFGNQDI